MRHWLLAPLLFVAAGACTTVEEQMRAHDGPMRAALERVARVGPALASTPTLGADTLDAGETTKVSLALGPYGVGDAALVYAEDLAKPGELGPVYARVAGTTLVPACQSMFAHRTLPWDPLHPDSWTTAISGSNVGSHFEACERLKWLFVIRTIALARPTAARVVGEDGGAAAAAVSPLTCRAPGKRCTFDSGWLEAEVHLFALEPLAYRGGVRVSAESTASVEATASATEAVVLEENLRGAFARSIASAIQKRMPHADTSRLAP